MSEQIDLELVKNIVPYFNDDTFNDRFEHMTRKLSKSRRFLVKMELSRLYAECSRNIDLRGKVEGVCEEYQHQGLTHHLDSVAIDVFEEAVSVYNTYTTGVFEEVTNTRNSYREKQIQQDRDRRDALKNQTQRQQHKPTNVKAVINKGSHDAEVILLTDFQLRHEERINLLTRVNVRLANGKNIQGITSNLSTHGAKLKLAEAHEIDIDDILYVSLNDLVDEETNQPIKLDITYQVVELKSNGDAFWFGLKRQHQDSNLDGTIAQFIKTQRKKAPTDVEHIIGAVRSLGFQQLYLNKMSGLPMFFDQTDGQYQALFSLCNNTNRDILNYWHNQQNLLKIVGLFSQARMDFLTAPDSPNHAIVYCFTHISKGKKFFYSATAHELEQTGLADLFMQFGASKDSWKVYQLFVTPIVNHQWQLPDVLPQHLIHKEELSLEQHKHLLKLHQISLMTYLIDISDQHSHQYYQLRTPSESKLNQLQQFGHKDSQPIGVDIIETNNLAQRREDRFNYQTKISITHGKKQYQGATSDFSVHGMQISMKHSIEVSKGEIIKLEMPLLEKVSGNKEMSRLEYEVMRTTPDGRTLNLRIKNSPEFEHGPKLLYRIIKKNQHKLTAQMAPPANLTKSINLFFCHHIDCLPLIIAKEGNHYKVSHVVQPAANNSLFNLLNVLSTNDGYCNLAAITQQNTFKDIFGNTLKQLTPNSRPATKEIYIQLINDSGNNEYRTVTKYFEEFETADQHRQFITTAKAQGQLFAVRIVISRSLEMNYKQVSRELIYAAKQASFKTRQLQSELDSVVGIAELVDIRDEVSQRFML